MKLGSTHGQIAFSASARRALPSLALLLTSLVTLLISILGAQIYASWKLGIRVRLNVRLIGSVFLPVPTPPQRAPHPLVQHQPFTERPVLLYGDSQLQFLSAWQPITSHPVLVWKPACPVPTPAEIVDKALGTDIVILHVGHGDIMRDKSDNQILEAYNATLNCLRDKFVIVLLPVPINELLFRDAGLAYEAVTNRRLIGLRAKIDRLCAAYPNVSTIDITSRIVDPTGEVPRYLLVDRLHFTPDIYAMWWEAIRDRVSARTNSRQNGLRTRSGAPTDIGTTK